MANSKALESKAARAWALQLAASEVKFAIAEAEQQEAQSRPPTWEERQALYLRRAEKIVDVYLAEIWRAR